MKLIDLNLLLYAVNQDGPKHAKAKAWLDSAFESEEFIALPWVVLLGFLRISTHPRIFEKPLPVSMAIEMVESWVLLPQVRVIQSGKEHWPMLRGLLLDAGVAGNLTTDAHLAALAIEHGCTLYTSDTDFARFRHLKWENPLLS